VSVSGTARELARADGPAGCRRPGEAVDMAVDGLKRADK